MTTTMTNDDNDEDICKSLCVIELSFIIFLAVVISISITRIVHD